VRLSGNAAAYWQSRRTALIASASALSMVSPEARFYRGPGQHVDAEEVRIG